MTPIDRNRVALEGQPGIVYLLEVVVLCSYPGSYRAHVVWG